MADNALSHAAPTYNLIGLANQGLDLFNGWDLQNASYNGVNFYLTKPAGSGSITNLIDGLNTATAMLGMNTNNFPLNANLPQGTKEYLQEMRDSITRKLVVHNFVNTNANLIEDLGFAVERFNGIGLIIGDSYYAAYTNLYNYFLARQGDVTFDNIPLEFRNVLQHPIRGKIEGVFLQEFRVIHNSQRWKGILFEFSLIAQEVTAISQNSQSILSKINQGFNLVIASINDILTIVSQIQAYGNMLSTYFNTTTPNNVVNFTNNTLPKIKTTTVPLLKNMATIFYNNISASKTQQTYTNYYFENQKVDYSNLPELMPYTNNADDTTINALLQIYNTNVQNNINQINSYGLNIQANDLITALKNSYVNLLNLAQSLAFNNTKQFISYQLPYTMSIREVCFNNNLDFNNADIIQTIITANPGKFASVNKIATNTILLLARA